LLQSLEIFVIDLFDAFGSELTKLTSTEKTRHVSLLAVV
jgi:hypothetical protein